MSTYLRCHANSLPRSGGSRSQSLATRSLICAASYTIRAWVLKSGFLVGNRLDASTTLDAHRDANLVQHLPSTAMKSPHLRNTLRNKINRVRSVPLRAAFGCVSKYVEPVESSRRRGQVNTKATQISTFTPRHLAKS